MRLRPADEGEFLAAVLADHLPTTWADVQVGPESGRGGPDYQGLVLAACPFHDAAVLGFGALVGHPDDGTLGCSRCEWRGDLAAFLEAAEGIGRDEAEATLAGRRAEEGR
jgi:hypothetical protein